MEKHHSDGSKNSWNGKDLADDQLVIKGLKLPVSTGIIRRRLCETKILARGPDVTSLCINPIAVFPWSVFHTYAGVCLLIYQWFHPGRENMKTHQYIPLTPL